MSAKPQTWRVNSHCINCMSSRTMAPDLIKEEENRSVFVRQPATPEEETAAWRALEVCPTAAVEAPSDLARPKDLFPQDLNGGVFRLGNNAKSSYGAHSYFGVVGDVRFMIDAPRWSAHLVSWMEGKDGLDHILLTHRDDVADAARYAKHFGSKVWIHEEDADSAPFATDVMRGDNPPGPSTAIKVLSVPGHTRGSVMYLLNDHTLFTGDSLAWDTERQAENFARARKARDALPEIFGAETAAKMLKPRGRPKSGTARTSISLRLPPETLARWKATGPGWQTRMADALSKAVD